MSIKFRILWFEDNEEWYITIKENITNYLASKNFVAEFNRYDSADSINGTLEIFEYDLILVDLKLDHGTKGTNAIKSIREKNILSDALFYSSDGVDKIRTEMGTEIFEGVYFSSRDDIPFGHKVNQLIDKAVRRMEDIISTRGMLVDSLSEFDEKLRSLALNFYGHCSESEKEKEIDRYMYKLIVKQLDSNRKKIDSFNGDKFLEKVLTNSYLVDSAKLARIVQHILNTHYPQKHYRKDFFKTYSEKIITERNNLAHAKKEKGNNGRFYFKKSDGTQIVYNSEKCSQIRSDINCFDEEINKMFELII